MLDYLEGILAGRENGVEVTMRLNAEKALSFATTLVAADKIGVVTHRRGVTVVFPWDAIRKIEVKDNAL